MDSYWFLILVIKLLKQKKKEAFKLKKKQEKIQSP